MNDTPEHTGFIGLYTGPIDVGMTFLWEPNNTHARKVLTVVRVQNRPHDEPAIWTCKTIWNDESRFREAVVALPAPTPEQIMADPRVKALVEAVQAEIEARNLFLSTAPDRGGRNGTKGQRKRTLENAQLDTYFALRTILAALEGGE